jgi:hypothetical protein
MKLKTNRELYFEKLEKQIQNGRDLAKKLME